ncbi:MAG: hypothetical protein ABIR79_02740 [Candidatus Binatia bacterium]
MANDAVVDERGRAIATVTATEAKNAFGRVLDAALTRGVVAITKRESARRRAFDGDVRGAGLSSPERHLARVAARVRCGGHDIPEHDVRRRYDERRHNLVVLLSRLRALSGLRQQRRR